MIIMFRVIFSIAVLFLLISCGSSKIIPNDSCSSDKYSILDSLNYIELPDDDLGIEGNVYYERLISRGTEIVPYLIEKIQDTLVTDTKIVDIYYLRNSDVAILLLEQIYKKRLPLWDILFDEFKDELKGREKYTYYILIQDIVYYDLFFSNTEEQNYQNRIRLYKRIKEWYEKDIII